MTKIQGHFMFLLIIASLGVLGAVVVSLGVLLTVCVTVTAFITYYPAVGIDWIINKVFKRG